MKVKSLFYLNLVILLFGCNDKDTHPKDSFKYHEFSSFADFKSTLHGIAAIEDQTEREEKITILKDSLKTNKQIPFVFHDSVAFLYFGNANTVSWAGDFNSWNPSSSDYQGIRIGSSNIWIVEKSYPLDARLDYKIVLNASQWVLDSNNPYTQSGGFGPNSELRMPEWVYPFETILETGANRGQFLSNTIINSSTQNLGYSVQYRVYLPYGYDQLSNLPVIYVTDGHEYSADQLGSMIIVLDNLIHKGLINPVIAVFIDPRDPNNLSSNRRMSEYAANIKYANFVCDELVPVIDATYKTSSNPDHRAILGTSMGGWNSAFFGLMRSDIFHLIGIHSPAFDNAIILNYQNAEKLPLKIFMSTGVIYDTQDRARAMKAVMEQKQYPLEYIEVNQSHSWGNWRGLLDAPLVFFFGK